MFRYGDTGRQSQPCEKQNKVVAQRRNKTYNNYIYVKGNKKVKVGSDQAANKLEIQGFRRVKTFETKGWEIVREMAVDPKGPNVK